jgi:hypothetical protein
MATNFPETSEEVLRIIAAAERHRKFVWTAGRVFREMALWTRLEKMSYPERKAMLRRMIGHLDVLEKQGILQRRTEMQSIGYGDETGFDYIQIDNCSR